MALHVSLTQGAKSVMKTNFESSVSIALTPSHSTPFHTGEIMIVISPKYRTWWNFNIGFTIWHTALVLTGIADQAVLISQETGQKFFPFKVIGRAMCPSYHQWTCRVSQEPGSQTSLEHLICSTLRHSQAFFPLIRGKGLFVQTPVACTEYGHWNCTS